MLSNKLQLWAYWHDKDEEKSIGFKEWKKLYTQKKS